MTQAPTAVAGSAGGNSADQDRAWLRQGVLPGAAAGLVGGIVFGLAWIEFGTLRSVSSIIRVDSAAVGLVIHLLISAIFGAIFGLLVWHQRPGAGETMMWGLAYGAFLWVAGALTLFPLFRGLPPSWAITTAQDQFPALLGHLLYGAFAGLALVIFTYRRQAAGGTLRVGWAAVFRGALAGFLASVVVGLILGAAGQFGVLTAVMGRSPIISGWPLILVLGTLAGSGFALLYPRPKDRIGTGLIHGVAFGFLIWVLVVETILPLYASGHLGWDVESARGTFALFPAALTLGGLCALLYKIFDKTTELAFAEDVGRWDDSEGVGTQGLRALGRGAMGGIIGGLLFTLVMLQMGVLSTVAELVGASSTFAGFVVHMVIATIIGITYGLLFQRQSHDLGSALGWGMAYGLCWWIIGWLTLLPMFLGGSPLWIADSAAAAIPALIGHFAYGAGLGIVFFLFESRHDPWWVSPAAAEAERLAGLRQQVLSSAPAVWSLIAVIVVVLPLVLFVPDQADPIPAPNSSYLIEPGS